LPRIVNYLWYLYCFLKNKFDIFAKDTYFNEYVKDVCWNSDSQAPLKIDLGSFTAMQSNEMKYRLDTIKGLNKVKESNVVANFLLNLATLGLFNHFGGNI